MAHPHRRPATPADALTELVAGNHRFVHGTPVHPNQDAEHRAALAAEQRPFAVVLGCSDSRLAAEIIFDRGLGDLFVVRTAGHVLGPEVVASIAYGVTVLAAPLVVVLGHDSCGAIQAAVTALSGETEPGPHLRALTDRVIPGIRDAYPRHTTDPARLVDVHVRHTVEELGRPGTAVAEAVTDGRCAVVGMSYRLADGRVTTVTPVPGATPPADR